MNVLFEEEGTFKTASLLADNNTSLQLELPGGRRIKVKSTHVLLRFGTPTAAEFLEQAQAAAALLDIEFLWESCGDDEFAFSEFAADYVGHAPSAVEAASLLIGLHQAPVYFHRKGRGRFRKAPPEILQAALAGQEKKRQQALVMERISRELQAGQLPEELQASWRQLLFKPDRNRLETKAFEEACETSGLTPARLLVHCGALNSAHDVLLERFLAEYFPQGTDHGEHPKTHEPAELPLASVRAFSIDDAHTTEIDDALSVTVLPDGAGWSIGIHIAAPALGMKADDALGQVARHRLSTVYMPGRKITMLPEDVVDQYTLLAGRDCPALSMYLDVARDFTIRGRRSCIERVPIVANLRHHEIEPLFNTQTLAAGLSEFPFASELKLLWELAQVLEAGRGKAGQAQNRFDFNFAVDWSASARADHEPGYVTIERRPRGSPLDTLVAELMIVANAGWGRDLADAKVAALYRAQTAGKVRMTTIASPHEGLGVDCYTWLTSPLRRYVDLLNQWQLVSWLRAETPLYTAKSADFLAALRDFELTYAAYAEFQRGMERYWCLRWLQQQASMEFTAQVLREELVRLEAIPLVLRLPAQAVLADLAPGTRVQLAIERIDLFDLDVRAQVLRALDGLAAETEMPGENNHDDAADGPAAESTAAG